MEQGRRKEYQKDPIKENVLEHMNNGLFELEKKLVNSNERPDLPIIFIVGAQRSGTTLLMQLIAAAFRISYPNNLISRFWKAPYIGAALYQSLPVREDSKFTSDLGYTDGVSGPHEFGYFWKRWFPWEPDEHFDYDSIDYALLVKELAAWQELTHQPLVFKNLIQVAHHIEKLHELFPNACFIHIQRDDVYTIQSSYFSRIKLYDTPEAWLGVKPKNFRNLLEISNPLEQITAQVYHVKSDLEKQFKQLPKDRVFNLTYEHLVDHPEHVLNEIEKYFSLSNWRNTDFQIPNNIQSGNQLKLKPEQVKLIDEKLRELNTKEQ